MVVAVATMALPTPLAELVVRLPIIRRTVPVARLMVAQVDTAAVVEPMAEQATEEPMAVADTVVGAMVLVATEEAIPQTITPRTAREGL